jgi:dihydroflavonol-4-reductase
VKPTLVTGATGFLGWHVTRQLLDRGDSVRVLVRDPKRLRELDGVEAVRGDLRDAESLSKAVQGCALVFHVAADYRLWSRDPNELYRSNVQGTRNVLNEARRAGVERVVYTSTVGCIGVPEKGVGNENNPVSLDDMVGTYKRSKFLAEKVALEFAANGFPVVIVNPTAPIGDHDFKPTPTGRIVVDYLRRRMPAFMDTGLNVVDARDTAHGHLLACERGKAGERYILGCENMTLRQIFAVLERISGVKAPTVEIPYAAALLAGYFSTAWARVSGSEPRAPLEGVRMAKKKMFVTHEKARRELGFDPGPAEDALKRAAGWFQANGYVQ